MSAASGLLSPVSQSAAARFGFTIPYTLHLITSYQLKEAHGVCELSRIAAKLVCPPPADLSQSPHQAMLAAATMNMAASTSLPLSQLAWGRRRRQCGGGGGGGGASLRVQAQKGFSSEGSGQKATKKVDNVSCFALWVLATQLRPKPCWPWGDPFCLQVSKRGKVSSRPSPQRTLKQLQEEEAAYQSSLLQRQEPPQPQQQRPSAGDSGGIGQPQQPPPRAAAPFTRSGGGGGTVEYGGTESVPESVTNRMLGRVILFSGLPVFGGILLFPFFYWLKVPLWCPPVVLLKLPLAGCWCACPWRSGGGGLHTASSLIPCCALHVASSSTARAAAASAAGQARDRLAQLGRVHCLDHQLWRRPAGNFLRHRVG